MINHLTSIHTWFLDNYVVVSACAKFNFFKNVFIPLTLHFEQTLITGDLKVPQYVSIEKVNH